MDPYINFCMECGEPFCTHCCDDGDAIECDPCFYREDPIEDAAEPDAEDSDE